MEVADHPLQALVEDVGVDLGRGDVGVPEEFLHDAQVRAVLQEVTGEGVAQDVRADPVGTKSGEGGDILEVAREGLPGQKITCALPPIVHDGAETASTIRLKRRPRSR